MASFVYIIILIVIFLFLLYLLFFRPKLNVQMKRIAAISSVLIFILVYWIIPLAIDEWKSHPIFIEHELGSVYTINFQDEYELIKEELKLENNRLRLEDFQVNYTEDGRINNLRWQLLGQNGSSYNLYQIQYDNGKNRYRIMYTKLDTWLQYNRLINADYFFSTLNMLDIKDITKANGDFSSYVIQSSGERINYGIENHTHFVLSDGEVQLLDDEQLPVEGYLISTFAMKKTEEKRNNQGNIVQESFEGTESSDFLFDVNLKLRQDLTIINLEYKSFETKIYPQVIESSFNLIKEEVINDYRAILFNLNLESEIYGGVFINNKLYSIGPVSMSSTPDDLLIISKTEVLGKKSIKFSGVFGANYARSIYIEVKDNSIIPFVDVDGNVFEVDLDNDNVKEIVTTIGTIPETSVYRVINDKVFVANINKSINAQAVLFNKETMHFEVYREPNKKQYYVFSNNGLKQINN